MRIAPAAGVVAQVLLSFALAAGSGLEVPDFFLLGVQKSSTTFISKVLARHPSLCFGRLKEPHFFDSVESLKDETDTRFNELLRRYNGNFRKCHTEKVTKLTFDATPLNWLMWHQISSMYSKAELSKKKFVVILRHPVDREFSWYNHQLRSCLYQMRKRPVIRLEDRYAIHSALSKHKLCEKVLTSEDKFQVYNGTETDEHLIGLTNLKSFRQYALPADRLRGDSLYVHLLQEWLQIIKRSQLLILNFRFTITNRTEVLDSIASFLDLKESWSTNYKLPSVFSSHTKGSNLDCHTSQKLNEFFERKNKNLVHNINTDIFGERPQHEPYFLSLQPEYTCH